jgi:hypothetical protein
MATAGDKYVPDSSPSGGCNHFPFNAGWSGSNGEWRYQAVFTATQLGSTPFILTGLSWAPCSTGTFAAKKFQIRVAHLSGAPTNNMDSNLGRSPTIVRNEGPITWQPQNATWSPIPLDCPFAYDGRSSLVVEVRYAGGAVSGGFSGPVVRASVAPRIYAYGTGAYTNATGSNPSNAAFKVRITHADVTPSSAAPSIGSTVGLLLDSYPEAGGFYMAASSFGTGPFMLGCWTVKLDADPLFLVTLLNLAPTLFQSYQANLDKAGQAKAAVAIPRLPALVGISIHTAFMVPTAGVISDTGSFKIDK